MILIRVLFNYSDEFKKLSYKSRFIAHHYIGNEWFSAEFCSTILMNWRIILQIEIHSTLHRKWMILSRVLFNYSHEFKKLILQIEIYSTSLHRKWMILKRVLFNYSDEFKKLSYKSRFIAHYIGNEWFWTEFCSTILMNSTNYPTNQDS